MHPQISTSDFCGIWSLDKYPNFDTFLSEHMSHAEVLIFEINAIFDIFRSAEVLPNLTAEELVKAQDVLGRIELFYTIVFTIELLLNFFANHFWPFFQSGWNIFDLLVVVICWLAEASDAVPNVSLLRLLRVFRVVR